MSGPPTSSRRREVALAAMLVVALVAAATAFVGGRVDARFGTEDANIYLRYARHVAAGDGLSFNRGGAPVEGFSSPAWLAIATLVELVGLPGEAALRAISAALVAGTLLALLLAIGEVVDRAPERRAAWAIVVLGALAAPDHVAWSILSLMETPLVAALLAVSIAGLARGAARGADDPGARRLLLATTALLPWARPEGAAFALLLVPLAGSIASARRLAVAWTGSVGLLFAWRRIVFDAWLPNTFFAKVSTDPLHRLSEGAAYLARYLAKEGVAGAVAVGLAVALAVEWAVDLARNRPGGRTPWVATARTAGVLATLGLVLPVLEGGEYFGGGRFFQPIRPLLVLVVALTWVRIAMYRRVSARPGTRTAWIAVAVLAAVATAGRAAGQPVGFADQFEVAVDGRRVGAAVSSLLRSAPETVVGIQAIGGFGVAWSGPIFDLLGLTDREMGRSHGDRTGVPGHDAFDPEIFWRRPPGLLMPTVGSAAHVERYRTLAVTPESFKDVTLRGLLRSPRFRAEYEAVELDLACVEASAGDPPSSADSPRLFYWARRDAAAPSAAVLCRIGGSRS